MEKNHLTGHFNKKYDFFKGEDVKSHNKKFREIYMFHSSKNTFANKLI